MPPTGTSARLRRDLRVITADGAFFSFTVGAGETYLPAFVLALGFGDALAGLVAVVPMLGGAVVQLLSPWAVSRLGSLRRWVVIGASVQAASFLPLIIAALVGRAPAWLVFLAATAYWTGGMSCGPAWITWIGRLVPNQILASFLARRNLFCQVSVLLGLLIAGLTLEWAGKQRAVQAFAVVFAVAMLARFASSRCLAAQSDSPSDVAAHRRVSFRELAGRFRRGAEGRLIVFLVAAQLTARLAEPYYNPYLLSNLAMPYVWYMGLIAVFFIAKAAASPAIGRVAFRFGTRRLLWVGAAGLVPLPLLWIASPSWPYLFLVHILNGFAWSAYELAVILLFFEIIREEERTSILTMYNLLVSGAMALGGVLGGGLLHVLGETRGGYHTLFVVSALARAAALLLLIRATPAAGRRPPAISPPAPPSADKV